MTRENLSRMAGKSELTAMATATDAIDEASLKLRELARPVWTDTRSYSLSKVARVLGLSQSQARRIVYRECKRIDAHVLDNIRAAHARLEARADAFAEHQRMLAEANQRERGTQYEFSGGKGDFRHVRLDREQALRTGDQVLERSETHTAPAGHPRRDG